MGFFHFQRFGQPLFGPRRPRTKEEEKEDEILAELRAQLQKARDDARELLCRHPEVESLIEARFAEEQDLNPHMKGDHEFLAMAREMAERAARSSWAEAARILERERKELRHARRRRIANALVLGVVFAAAALIWGLNAWERFVMPDLDDVFHPREEEVGRVIGDCRHLIQRGERVDITVAPWPVRSVTTHPMSSALSACVARSVDAYAPWRDDRRIIMFTIERPWSPEAEPSTAETAPDMEDRAATASSGASAAGGPSALTTTPSAPNLPEP